MSGCLTMFPCCGHFIYRKLMKRKSFSLALMLPSLLMATEHFSGGIETSPFEGVDSILLLDMDGKMPTGLSEKDEEEVRKLYHRISGQPQSLKYELLTETSSDPSLGNAAKATAEYELAKLYENVMDYAEALEHAHKAVELLPSDSRFVRKEKLLAEQVKTKATMSEQFRKNLSVRGYSITAVLGAEYDSNVILEEKDPLRPSDKEDAALIFNVQMSKQWTSKDSGILSQSDLQVYQSSYMDHSELNMGIYNLSHTLGTDRPWGRDYMKGGVRLAVGHIVSDGSGLLNDMAFYPNFSYYTDDLRGLWNVEAGYRSISYNNDDYSKLDGKVMTASLRFSKYLGEDLSNRLELKAFYKKEDTESIQFDNMDTGIGLKYTNVWGVINQQVTFSVYSEMYARSYDFDPPNLPIREDDNYMAGIRLDSAITRHLFWSLAGEYTDNKSNVDLNEYEKYRIALSLSYNF